MKEFLNEIVDVLKPKKPEFLQEIVEPENYVPKENEKKENAKEE